MVDIVARTEPDLEDPPRQTAGQFGAPPPQSGSPTRSVHQYREDPLAVETHAARLPSRRRRRSPEMARRWGSGPVEGRRAADRHVVSRLTTGRSGSPGGGHARYGVTK
jgi:hypothetical protein